MFNRWLNNLFQCFPIISWDVCFWATKIYQGSFINGGRITITGAYSSAYYIFYIGLYSKADSSNINSSFMLSSSMLGNWCSPTSLKNCVSASVFCNNDSQDNTSICYELSNGVIYKRKNGNKNGWAYYTTWWFSTVMMTYF